MASVIIGVRTQAQFDDNLKAAELKLSKEHVDRLGKISMFNLDYPHDFLNMVEGKW
jgi:aryl-alcohol dehydrogenase-like predicted oxidoreductase